ncbi:hypothetical protein D4R52_02595 [bacterium]|nr:MAG: hypothetical protein D4R52_02595 [bacterium]
MKWTRIWAFLLRHLYEIGSSLDRQANIVFYPVIDILTFGLLTVYINKLGFQTGIAGGILGGIILWTLVYNIQRDIAFSILDDAWSRSLYNLFASPLRTSEFVAGTLLLSVVKAFITISVILLMAFSLFNFDLLQYGLIMFYYIFNIFIFGWAFGFLTSALIFRFGTKVQSFAWSLILIIYPISGVFYPLSVLPPFLAKIALGVPLSYIFEGFRNLITTGKAPNESDLLAIAGLNVVYMLFGVTAFFFGIRSAKKRGWFVHPT